MSIITFNYDVAVDIALLREHIQPDYAIEMPFPFKSESTTLPLLKLHGSLNWAVEESASNAILPLNLAVYLDPSKRTIAPTVSEGHASVQLLPHLVDYFSKLHKRQVKPLPYLVPPSWNKADYHKGLTDVWAAAAKHLSEALHIFVIGYSLPLTDSFFRQLYALGSAGETRLRNFTVFDPDPTGEVDARFRDLMGTGVESRYKLEKKTFAEAVPILKKLFEMR